MGAMYFLVGMLGAGLFLIGYWRLDELEFARQCYVAFAVMLAIYVGAHLVYSDLDRVIAEALFASVILFIANAVTERWPSAIGVLILFHAIYDFALGDHVGMPEWYPPICVGFDVVVGAVAFYRLHHTNLMTSA